MLKVDIVQQFGLDIPLIQAPMAGVSTPVLAAKVCNSGGIGSLGLGALSVFKAAHAIAALREMTQRPFNINFFCHKPRLLNKEIEKNWLDNLQPLFHRFLQQPPRSLHPIYDSFNTNDELLKLAINEKPAIVSFHFGIPDKEKIRVLKQAGIFLMASATNLDDAKTIEKAGFDAVIAQGYEAGGHRAIFDENSPDSCLSLIPLMKILIKHINIPVVAAGGIMDGHDIAAMIKLGASAVQMGTAFISCDESEADIGYRQTLASQSAYQTLMTRVFSGRPARALCNHFTRYMTTQSENSVPPYPYAYDAAKNLIKAASSHGDFHYGAYWAGQGAPLSRPMKADLLMTCLKQEYFESF